MQYVIFFTKMCDPLSLHVQQNALLNLIHATLLRRYCNESGSVNIIQGGNDLLQKACTYLQNVTCYLEQNIIKKRRSIYKIQGFGQHLTSLV